MVELKSAIPEGRGKNAVAQLLSRRLIVPKIFFDAEWPDRKARIDVLAVDRSGAGDVHAVEIKVGKTQLDAAIRSLVKLPAQYKYLAYFSPGNGEKPLFPPDSDSCQRLYARDGMGRVGTIHLNQVDPRKTLTAEIEIYPERFQVPPSLYQEIDRYADKHTPDLAIRP